MKQKNGRTPEATRSVGTSRTKTAAETIIFSLKTFTLYFTRYDGSIGHKIKLITN